MSNSNSNSSVKIFLAFLALGCTSFGGPIAHLGYFREAFVARRRWLSDSEYADLVGLCQFLPGPASSQVGMGIGYRLNGLTGALAAWLGFTLPSAVIMMAGAYLLTRHPAWASSAWVHGLKIAAAVIVAQAIIGMWKTLCPDLPRRLLAVVAAVLMLVMDSAVWQVAVIGLTGAAGFFLSRTKSASFAIKPAWGYLAGFVGLLFALPVVAAISGSSGVALVDGFYRAGALVFGGGHVVLPLLEAETVGRGWIANDAFLAGYGLAQALPGPLFTFAGYLGTAIGGWQLGMLGLIAIFAASLLLLAGVLPAWHGVQSNPRLRDALSAINATVVGILIAAWINPVVSSGIVKPADALIAISAFAVAQFATAPPMATVVFCALAAWTIS